MKCCPNCGAPQPQPVEVWPHKCLACGTEHFSSPKPVVAMILHAQSDAAKGIVAIRRGIEPYKGTWAFPGGYIDHKEDWRQTAAREAHEELGINLDPKMFVLHSDPVVTPTNYLVLFARYIWTLNADACLANPNPREVQEVRLLNRKDQERGLVFGVPSHHTVWKSLRLPIL